MQLLYAVVVKNINICLLCGHKHKCTFQTKKFQENESPPEEIVPPVIEKQDTMIDKLVTSITEIKEDTQEMKKMMMTMINMQYNQKLQTNHSNV